MKISDRVLITCTNFPGKVLYQGEGCIKEVRNHSTSMEYIIICKDGANRSVEVGNPYYKGDKICLM